MNWLLVALVVSSTAIGEVAITRGMKQAGEIDRAACPKIETDCGRDENEKRQPRFYELRNIGQTTRRESAGKVDLVTLETDRFHALTGSSLDRRDSGISVAVCCFRQNAEIATPKANIVAPTATCAVAMSAALLLQIVQAPSASCTRMPVNQAPDNLRSGENFSRCAATKKAMMPTVTTTAPNRWAIWSQICSAVTSDKPRASRTELILAMASELVSGIQ